MTIGRQNSPHYFDRSTELAWHTAGQHVHIVRIVRHFELGAVSVRVNESELAQLGHDLLAEDQPYRLRRPGEVTFCGWCRPQERRVQQRSSGVQRHGDRRQAQNNRRRYERATAIE